MMLGGAGHSFKLFKKSFNWTWGSSSLLAGFVRSGTGWGMELSLQGQCVFKTRFDHHLSSGVATPGQLRALPGLYFILPGLRSQYRP